PYNGPASLAPQPIAAGGYGGAANFAMRGGSFAPPPPAMPSAGQVFQQKQFEVSERRQSGVKEYNKRSEYNKQSAADKKADKTVSKLSAQLQSLIAAGVTGKITIKVTLKSLSREIAQALKKAGFEEIAQDETKLSVVGKIDVLKLND